MHIRSTFFFFPPPPPPTQRLVLHVYLCPSRSVVGHTTAHALVSKSAYWHTLYPIIGKDCVSVQNRYMDQQLEEPDELLFE